MKSGRKPGYKHNQRTRDAIQAGNIVDRLAKHIKSAKGIMNPSQVNAAKILLAKVLPDLSQVDATVDQRVTMTDEEINDRIAVLTGSAPGATESIN